MDPSSALTWQELSELLDELHEDFQRRQDQAILQQDLYKANYALAGKETCGEVRRRLERRLELHRNVLRSFAEKKRA
jgi:hypothetical protein